MYCTNCGAFVADGQAYCTSCGEKLTDTPLQSNPPQQPSPAYSYGETAPQNTAAGYGYSVAKPKQAAPAGYHYGPENQTANGFDWEHLQPRSGPAKAGSLIFGVGILIAALFLLIWGTAFISPGGLGSDETVAMSETKKSGNSKKETTAADKVTKSPAAASTKNPASVPTEVPTIAPTQAAVEENTPGELPASVAAKVNKNASREDYYGSYTGTLTVNTYDLDKLAAASGAPAGQLDAYEAISGHSYAVTADYEGSYVKVVSNEFPYTSPGTSILEGPAKEEPENGCTRKEQVVEQDGYVLKNSEQVWFLQDGSLYLINAITASKDGKFVGGMIITAVLKPAS